MSNSINETFYNRLVLQSLEVEQRGDKDFSQILTKVASNQSVRSEDEEKSYQYSDLDLWKDCKVLVVEAAVRFADYYGNEKIDFDVLNPTLNTLASHLFKTLAKNANLGNKLAGKYEPKLPGEE
jgi:hypothetical protein